MALTNNNNISTPAQKALKVAAYCRVSTLYDEQEDSLENQSVHYTNYIRENPEWRFVGIYSDHGKSGTMTEGRSGFKRLIRHAILGKVDLVLCKSVSRFARNVFDTIDKIRMLKEKGVRVIFEKENIDTDDMQSEFILTMMAAVAQEESRSISENVSWGIRKRLARGKPQFYRQLGYIQQDNKNWVIEEKEAAIVREAFQLCLNGKSPPEIARTFIRKGYKTARGRKEWSGTAIRDILRNERYVGDILGQKTYVKDYLNHEMVRNKGEKRKYLISNHHKPIIDRKTFAKVQEMLLKRTKPKKMGKKKSYPLSGRITCGQCGSNLQRFAFKGVVTWRCGKTRKSKLLCQMKGVKETNIIKAMSIALKDKNNQQLKNVEISSDIEYNQIKFELESVLFKENMAVINGNDDIEKIKKKRIELEKKLKEKEVWWDLLDEDYKYRKKVNEKDKLEKIEYLRAWVVRIKAISPFSFVFTLVTGEEVTIDIS